MNRRNVIIAMLVGLFALGGLALAQTRIQGPQPPLLGGGPFAVSPVDQSAILVETSSGKTWEMTRSAEGQVVWLPCKRIDSEKEAEEWRQHEKKIKEQLDVDNKMRERERRLQEQKLKPVPLVPANPPATPK
jgi:hypothetical protein